LQKHLQRTQGDLTNYWREYNEVKSKLANPESAQTLINFVTHFRGANGEKKQPYWRLTKNQEAKKTFGPDGMNKIAELQAAVLDGAKKILSGKYIDEEKLRAAKCIVRSSMSWTDFQATPCYEKTKATSFPAVTSALSSWTKDNQMWLLKGTLRIVEEELLAKQYELNTAKAEEVRRDIMELPVDAFIQANCIIPTNDFLRTLLAHQVKSKITRDNIREEVLKLAIVKQYMTTKGVSKDMLRSSYKNAFEDFVAPSYKETLSRRRLIDQPDPSGSKPLTRGQRRELHNRTPSRRLMERLSRLEAEGSM